MSVLPRRWLLNAIIVLSFLVPLISFSQVTIKEKVEIKPKARLASSPATELRVVFYWLANKTPGGTDDPIHLGILEPNGESRGFDVRSGTKRGDYSEAITSVGENDYDGEDVYTNREARPGLYFFYAIADTSTGIIPMFGPYWVDVYIGGQLDRTIIFERFGWGLVPDTRYRVNTLMYTLLGAPGGPCAGAHFEFDEIQDVQHGETRTIHAPILDDCGNNVDPPPEYYYKYELLGDTLSWGVLRDPNTGRTGTMLDSVASTIVEFCAWGKEPESQKLLTVRVSAANGSITPATTTFTLLPPEVRVLAGKTTLAFGDSTLLTMEVRYPNAPWMSKPDDWKARFGIAQQDTFGSLYMLDSTDYNPDVTEYEPAVVYYAHPQAAADSDNVIILLTANEPGSGDSKIETPVSRGEGMLGKKSAPAPTVMTKSSSLKRPRGALASNRINFSTHYGLVRLKLGRNVLKILDHAPWTIWPSLPSAKNWEGEIESRGADRPGYNPKRSFTIEVQNASKQPMKNEAVVISTKNEVGSGGHGHVNGDRLLPQDETQGVFWSKGAHGNPIHLRSDDNGMIYIDSLIASQVSGKFLVSAMIEADTTAKDTVNMIVRVPGLVEFVTGEYWNPTGNTSTGGQNHMSNHWCNQRMKDSLSAALRDFYDWSLSTKGGNQAIKVGVNDMSLVWGGVFDIYGKWDLNRKHVFHRVGVSVDIDNTADGDIRYGDGALTWKGNRLKEIMEKYGGTKYREETIHFGFGGGQ